MNKFEDRLFADLMDEHGDDLANTRRSAARRGVPRPVMVAAGTVALAGVATAGVVATGGHNNPAYAVSVHSNGTVSMSLQEMKAVGPLNAKLRRLHVPIRAVRVRRGCTSTSTYTPDPGRIVAAHPAKVVSVVVRTRGLPAGQTIVVGLGAGAGTVVVPAIVRHGQPTALAAVSVGRVKGAVPPCLPMSRPHR